MKKVIYIAAIIQAVNWIFDIFYLCVHPENIYGRFETIRYLTGFVGDVLLLVPYYFGLNLVVGASKKFDTLRVSIIERHYSRIFLITAIAFTAWAGVFTIILIISFWVRTENGGVYSYS
jgi:hypothetical protein